MNNAQGVVVLFVAFVLAMCWLSRSTVLPMTWGGL